ncbi:hypothetical protein J6590_003494 [Homalodisca vitripennis]|nr:hypothetical protein J6590_003494 [Homalodisca vitripennis]
MHRGRECGQQLPMALSLPGLIMVSNKVGGCSWPLDTQRSATFPVISACNYQPAGVGPGPVFRVIYASVVTGPAFRVT